MSQLTLTAAGPSAGGGTTLLEGLLTYWALDEASGDRADSHENGYTLSEVGSLGSADGLVYAKAALFAGDADNYLERARASSALINFGSGDAFTIALWCYPTAWVAGSDSPNYYRYIMEIARASTWHGGYLLCTGNNGQPFFGLGGSGGNAANQWYCDPYDNGLNEWRFLVFGYDDSTGVAIYRYNDSQTYTDERDNDVFQAASTGDLTIGAYGNLGQYVFDGRMGPIATWNRVLTDAELDALYNNGNGWAYPC